MAVESAEDLEGFFDPDEFGESMIAHMAGGAVPFNGIFTVAPVAEKPGTFAEITGSTPRVIARLAVLADLKQNEEIERADTTRVLVNNVQIKGDLVIIHLHEVW